MVTVWSAIVQLNAQTTDWQVVQTIAPGSTIRVSALNHRGRPECELLKVTDSDLDCETRRGKRLVFRRNEIREIRLENPEHHHMILGAIVGGAIGAGIGALSGVRSGDPEARRADPAGFALIGGSLGAGIGRGIHQHGPVVYQRKQTLSVDHTHNRHPGASRTPIRCCPMNGIGNDLGWPTNMMMTCRSFR